MWKKNYARRLWEISRDNRRRIIILARSRNIDNSSKICALTNPVDDDNKDDAEAQFGSHGYYPYYPGYYLKYYSGYYPGYRWS
ncbi:unnamed protein product [Rhizophagus irregularis]|uniref:Uncharacterized protein n=1 Tax=Rhizophagus irregularis TaxID=588596 RepID=A0A916DZM5_9GLOM|nr:unnamed protein product [Rhizophagus irregularis]